MTRFVRRSSCRRAASLLAVGLGGLVVLGAAYLLTREPAPAIRVLWRDDVTSARRAELERKYLLVNPRAPKPSLAYDLLDSSRRNIEALVKDPEAADTNDIDRDHYEIRPGTVPGHESMWIAHRTPGLRDEKIRWTLMALLAATAFAGFVGLLPELRRIWTLHRKPQPVDTGDLFDRLDARRASGPAPTLGAARKFVAAVLLTLAIDVPALDTWQALALGAGLLAIVFGACRPGWRRTAAAVAVVIAAIGGRLALPRADVAEGHNAFLVIHDGEPLQQGLPPAVFESWKAQFNRLYPLDAATAAGAYDWRNAGVPKALFTTSADAIWRPSRYTRQVDAIEFHSLAEFRGGFGNETWYTGSRFTNLYNFWVGKLRREAMPFYVMYELTPASVGSRLEWKGQLFWEQADGGFQEIAHEQVAARDITAADAGRRVYAAFFPQRDAPLHFRMDLSSRLRFARWLSVALSLAAALLVLALTVRPRWGASLRALLVAAIGYVVVVSYVPARAEYLGRTYPPYSGGDDGMVHDGFGRVMAMLAGRGDIIDALKGVEPVYWFTPGTRYVRMVERLIFGDTNHLYVLVLAFLPLVVFYVARQCIGRRWAWALTAVFCVMPVGSLSLLQYVSFAKAGYGEPFGTALFLLGLSLVLRTQPAWGGSDRRLAHTWLAGAALALSMFVRPNLAFAVVWLGASYAWASFRRSDLASAAALAAGLALALWMPFHNWYYGDAFHLISRSGSTMSVTLGPGDYVAAVSDVLDGRLDGRAITATSQQVKGWLSGPGFVGVDALWLAWIAHAAKLLGLLVSCWVALRWATGRLAHDAALGVLAVTALCAHAPMLFIFNPYFRYASLAWDLSLLVLIVWLARLRYQPTLAAAPVVEAV